MVSREVPLSLLSGLGFKLLNKDKNQWEISGRAKGCIVDQLGTRGLRDGSVRVQDGGKGVGSIYTFTFKTRETPVKDHVYTMSYIRGEVYVEIDPTHLEESKTASEVGKSAEEAGEARLDKFFLGLRSCQKSYAFRAPPKPAPFAEPAPAMPAGPAAAGAGPGDDDPYGMSAAFARMGVREGGRRRKSTRKGRRKSRRSTRRKRFT
jgi:hypothetical protein